MASVGYIYIYTLSSLVIYSMASDDAELTVYLHRQRGDEPLRGE